MTEVWLPLNSIERTLLLEALAAYRGAEGANEAIANALDRKLTRAAPYPDITIGVHGGQVQWTAGNPFPIRICDYDGDKKELLSADERGERCRMWFEPSDQAHEQA